MLSPTAILNYLGNMRHELIYHETDQCFFESLQHKESVLIPTCLIYGGPEGTTLLLENLVSFCRNVNIIFRIKHLSLEFCHRSL